MGPHFFKCGKTFEPNLDSEGANTLQWGRTFSSAESHPLADTIPAAMVLQWGRTFSSAESCLKSQLSMLSHLRFNGAALFQVRKAHLRLGCECRIDASMGPHFFKCGKKRQELNYAKRKEASMGPHFFKCGKYCLFVMGPHGPECFNGAALFQVRKAGSPFESFQNDNWLQWGRTFSSAERPAPASRQAFSPAASMGPHFFKCGKA